ncbi:MAG: DNA-processing protein DprA [Rickettsiales bacterium]
MTSTLSSNTQAILLLTAPLIAGRSSASSELLSPGEYKRLARHLREIRRQPADLVSPEADEILRACVSVIDESRLQRLLGRGFLLSQAVERWQARAVWVISRADADYPRRLKARLLEDAPAIIYGCGDARLLDAGGLAVVGSRHVDDDLIAYAISVGRLTARVGRTLISGGAKGIDQAAMRGALEAGGKACGVLADSLEKTAMIRENRNLLLAGRLALISPYDPNAGFNVGNAMQRNKLIYALADVSLVASSDVNKGGTWAGAVEQLDKLKFAPVFVRSTGESSAGLEALRKKGALPWPNPQDADSFAEIINARTPPSAFSRQIDLPTVSNEAPLIEGAMPGLLGQLDVPQGSQFKSEPLTPVDIVLAARSSAAVSRRTRPVTPATTSLIEENKESSQSESTPAEALFVAVRNAIRQLLKAPMKDTEVAAALEVSNAQAKAWLQRLVDEGMIEKRKKPAGYIIKEKGLFA